MEEILHHTIGINPWKKKHLRPVLFTNYIQAVSMGLWMVYGWFMAQNVAYQFANLVGSSYLQLQPPTNDSVEPKGRAASEVAASMSASKVSIWSAASLMEVPSEKTGGCWKTPPKGWHASICKWIFCYPFVWLTIPKLGWKSNVGWWVSRPWEAGPPTTVAGDHSRLHLFLEYFGIDTLKKKASTSRSNLG